RNAEVKVFQEQRQSVVDNNLFSLNYNFRSAPEVLDFVNTFFQKTNSLSAVEETYIPMQAHRSSYAKPRVEFLLSVHSEDDKRTLKEDDVDIEAKIIAERIQSLVHNENPLMIVDEKTHKLRPVCYGDFALLFCTKNYIYKYEKALKDRGIPCFVVSSRGFFEITEIKDILNFLQVLINPYHDIALLSFLRGPFCGLSDEQITRWQMNLPLRNMLLNTNNIPDALTQDSAYVRVRYLYQYFRKKTHLPIHELIQEIVLQTGYESILLGHWFGEQRIANLQKFLALARAYQESNPVSLYQFHRFVERSRDKIMEGEADLATEAGDAVILTTIHQAKGLEYPIVVLPLLYEERQHRKSTAVHYHKEMGVIIKTKKKEDEKNNIVETIIKLQNTYDEYQEYIRLFYVALTRARDYLILSSNKKYLEEFYKKQKINSRLSLLASCFPLNKKKDTGLYYIIEREESNYSPKKKDLKREIKSLQYNLVPPISITPQHFKTEPISVTQILNFLFDDIYDEDNDEIYEQSLGMEHAERGIFYHQLLQLWDFHEENIEQLSKYILNIISPDILEDIIKNEKDVCFSKIINNPIYPILKANPPIWRETPFIWKTGGYFVQGTVDAILADGTIIDYKTGTHADNHAQRYWKQLEIYYYAMKDLGIKVNNKLIIVYIDQLKYDIKDIEVSVRDVLETEIHHAIEKYITKINQGYEK
ncbi:MAG: UvrD-helicase domain-containing protein, partial [Candidatus Hydrogenedens sp.]